MRKEGVNIGPLWEVPKKEVPTPPPVVEVLEEEEALGVVAGASQHPRREGKSNKWDPTELTPVMRHMMTLQFFNPSITSQQLADQVNLSVSHVRAILGSGMYRTKYNMRRVEIEQLQNSKVAEERDTFTKLRDEMIAAHKAMLELDIKSYPGKGMELERLKQGSIKDLLHMSVDQLKIIDQRLDGPDNGEGVIAAEVALDTSDPKIAYIRLMGQFRKSTK